MSALFIVLITIDSCKKANTTDPCLLQVEIQESSFPGEFKTLVFDGATPYSYQWTGGSPHLYGDGWRVAGASDTITVTVTDDLGCVATDTHYPPACGTDTIVTDANGNTYPVVSIGNQCWMAANLKVSAGIAEFANDTVWETAAGAGTPAWCWPLNSATNSAFGKLYNHYAVETGNLCPNGWHIPTVAEWETLVTYLGGNQVAGGAMKTEDTLYWNNPNTGATNLSGFSAVGAGGRTNQSLFESFRLNGIYWTATTTQYTATVIYLSNSNATTLYWERSKQAGYSCRCVKD